MGPEALMSHCFTTGMGYTFDLGTLSNQLHLVASSQLNSSLTLSLSSFRNQSLWYHSHQALVTLLLSLLQPVWANLHHYSHPLSWVLSCLSHSSLWMWARCLAPSSVYHLPRTTVWLYCVILDSNYRRQVCSTRLNSSRTIPVSRMVLFWERWANLRLPLQSFRLALQSLQCNRFDILAPFPSWSVCRFRFGRNWPYLSLKSFLAGVRLIRQFFLRTYRFSPVRLIKSWISQWTLVLGFPLFGSLIYAISSMRRMVAVLALLPCHSV